MPNPAVTYTIYCLTWDTKRSANFGLDLSWLRWDAGQPLLFHLPLSLQKFGSTHHLSVLWLSTASCSSPCTSSSCSYTGEKPVQSKTGLTKSGLGAGLWCLSRLWAALDEAGPALIWVASVACGGSAQPLSPGTRSLEFECFISRSNKVQSSMLLWAPAYHGSDMASLSKCLALLDSGWVLYWLLTLNKHLVFITNCSRPERGAVLGGAVT